MHYSGVDENPNTNWLRTRGKSGLIAIYRTDSSLWLGSWIVLVLVIFLFRLTIAGVPGITTELSWTLTNLLFNLATFVWFHLIIGTPFNAFHQNEYVGLTMWEQIDGGQQFTPTKKYLTALPIVLFLLSTHYSHYNFPTFMINVTSLIIVLIAKLPIMHKVRILGINKEFLEE